MTISYLAGTPRSGSTLLGNILAQHPEISVTGTSALYACVNSLGDALSNSPDVVSELENVPGSYERYVASVKAFMDQWHDGHDGRIVLDKHRAWPNRWALLSQVDGDSRMICCVRDPREIVASFERQERRTALFNSPVHQQITEYASRVMSAEGMVGAPIKLMEDLLTRRSPVSWVRYEQFITSPQPVLASLVDELGLEPYPFDLDNIENVATDCDAIYRGKYPHIGAGTLKPVAGSWRDMFNDELGAKIAGVHPTYMREFGYA